MMKLYEVYVNNGLSYEDEDHYTQLTVAENKEEAIENIKNHEDYDYTESYHEPYFFVVEITEIDGYKISISKEE